MKRDLAAVTWDGYTAEVLAEACGVPHLALLAETDSTQNIAHALAEEGAPAGTVVLADAQRAGRGRLGRTWASYPGHGVWCTVLERPNDARVMDVLSLRVGLCVAEALDRFADARVGVKWPNDLMLQGRKLGGVLVEARWSGSALAWVAIGVGVNVVRPPDVPGASGLTRDARRTDVLEAIVRAVRSAAAANGRFTNEELERYRARDTLAGRRIVSPETGRVIGVAESGALIVETSRGEALCHAGTIQLAEEQGGHA